MHSMYGHWRSWAALFIRYFVFVLIRFGLNFLCHPPMQVRWSSHPKLQFVIRLKSQSEKLAAMENLARSCCNHHGTRAVAPWRHELMDDLTIDWTNRASKITLFRDAFGKLTDGLVPCFARRVLHGWREERKKAAIMLLTGRGNLTFLRRTLIYLTIFRAYLCFASLVLSG
jgi:hypothetical protein